MANEQPRLEQPLAVVWPARVLRPDLVDEKYRHGASMTVGQCPREPLDPGVAVDVVLA